MRRTMTRGWLIAGGTAALVGVGLLIAWWLGAIAPRPGPLHAPGNGAGTNAAPGETVTVVLFVNDGAIEEPVELRSATVLGAEEPLKVGTPRILVCPGKEVCAVPFFAGHWPPRGAAARPVSGYVMDGTEHTRMSFPVEMPDGPGSYSIRGIELEYTQGLTRYRAEIGPNLTFNVRD